MKTQILTIEVVITDDLRTKAKRWAKQYGYYGFSDDADLLAQFIVATMNAPVDIESATVQ